MFNSGVVILVFQSKNYIKVWN